MSRQSGAAEPVKAALATRELGIAGVVRTARRNLLEIIPELAVHQPVVSGKLVKRWHMVMDPDGLRRIFQTCPEAYPKADVTRNILRPAIGESLFVAEGEHWLWQRRAAAKVFATRSVRNLSPVMQAATGRMIERIADNGDDPVDMHAEITRATFEVISDVTFSDDAPIDRSIVHRAINAYVAQSARVSLFDVCGFPDWIPRPGRIFSARSVREMKRIADDAIRARRASGKPRRGDLHDLLAEGEDPRTGRSMNPVELRDNLLTFIVAGHETTALALSWSLYLLAFDQDAQRRAREESRSAVEDRLPGGADLHDLPFVQRVIREALRLYPPAALLLRTALQPDTIWNREVRPGDTIMLPIYALHRSRCLWERPDSFDPDRFIDSASRDPYRFLPFGAGPRACIGSGFAMQEATIMLAALISNYRFLPVAGRSPRPALVLTLRPDGGVWLEARRVS